MHRLLIFAFKLHHASLILFNLNIKRLPPIVEGQTNDGEFKQALMSNKNPRGGVCAHLALIDL